MWIEIRSSSGTATRAKARRSPHGECGLKCFASTETIVNPKSLPAWGAWIEIGEYEPKQRNVYKSLPAWGVWIEILAAGEDNATLVTSLPAWGVWIEIRSI